MLGTKQLWMGSENLDLRQCSKTRRVQPPRQSVCFHFRSLQSLLTLARSLCKALLVAAATLYVFFGFWVGNVATPLTDGVTVLEIAASILGAWGRISFWLLVCYAGTPLALQLHQERVQVVHSKGRS